MSQAITKFLSFLEKYSEMYNMSDIRDVVLLFEGFSSNIKIPEPVFQSLLIRQDPIIPIYLPFLKHIDPLIELSSFAHFKKDSIKRFVLTERRKNLISIALTSKYALYVDLRRNKEYIETYIKMLNIIADIINRYYDDLDSLEVISLIYIYEVVNTIRNKLSKPPLDISSLRLENIINTDLLLHTKAGICALLFDIYKVTKKKVYLTKFYEISNDIDVEVLYNELKELEYRNEKVLREFKDYYGFDEDDIKALSIPLDEVELALVSKFVRTLREGYAMIPFINFDDFVSEYYSIPKTLLKAWKTLITYFK